MLDSVRKLVAVPVISSEAVLSVGVLATFAWLLAHDLVHPIAVFFLQLYLTF